MESYSHMQIRPHKCILEPQHEISNNVLCATRKGSDQPVHMRSLIRAFASRFEYYMSVNLLTEHNLEFQSLKKKAAYACVSLHLSI